MSVTDMIQPRMSPNHMTCPSCGAHAMKQRSDDAIVCKRFSATDPQSRCGGTFNHLGGGTLVPRT